MRKLFAAQHFTTGHSVPRYMKTRLKCSCRCITVVPKSVGAKAGFVHFRSPEQHTTATFDSQGMTSY